MSNAIYIPSPSIAATTVYDAGNNIYAKQNFGYLDFYFDTELAFRLRYDSGEEFEKGNGLWTTYSFKQDAISGAGVGPVEVISATEVNIIVNGIRRMNIDKTANQISFATRSHIPGNILSQHEDTPIADYKWRTLFSVFDAALWQYTVALQLDEAGKGTFLVPWRFRDNVAEIP